MQNITGVYNIRKKTKAETLEGFKQELTGLRKIGEAYERAGNAYRKLQEVVKEDRLLTEVERREITTALLTYTYLNGLQTKANAQAQTPEILGLNLINAQRGKIQLDQDGKRINPLVPGENQVPMRDYYLSAEEGRDLDSESMRLYNKPLQPVVKLNKSTLEQIQEHVMATEQAQALSNISDPMAFAKLFER